MKDSKDGKVGNHWVRMIFIGYKNLHKDNCYQSFNPMTSRVTEIRDVIWLRRMFYEWANTVRTRKEPIMDLEMTRESNQAGIPEYEPVSEAGKSDDTTKSNEKSDENPDD